VIAEMARIYDGDIVFGEDLMELSRIRRRPGCSSEPAVLHPVRRRLVSGRGAGREPLVLLVVGLGLLVLSGIGVRDPTTWSSRWRRS
jgi:hypothetical protein